MGDKEQADRQEVQLRPLTKRNSDGHLYQRDAPVERQIAEALVLTPRALLDRANVRDLHAPDFLQEEALVYLIREYFRQGNDDAADGLARALLERCVGFLNRKLQALGAGAFDDAYAEVINALILRVADLGSDRGDFLQVRFWIVLDRLATSAFDRYLVLVKAAAKEVPLSALAGEEAEQGGDDEEMGSLPLEERTDTTLPIADQVVLRDEFEQAQAALALIEEPYRTAFVLRHFYDWPIEDADPDEPTISRLFGKTPRTIRNWLAKADEALGAWRGARA